MATSHKQMTLTTNHKQHSKVRKTFDTNKNSWQCKIEQWFHLSSINEFYVICASFWFWTAEKSSDKREFTPESNGIDQSYRKEKILLVQRVKALEEQGEKKSHKSRRESIYCGCISRTCQMSLGSHLCSAERCKVQSCVHSKGRHELE